MWQLPRITVDEILIYLRKSRADDPLLSVDEVLAKHEQMLDDWVQRNFPDSGAVPEENRYREVVSGETIDSRPQVQALLRRIESPRYKALLIVEPQRLSRGDLEDIGRLVKLLRYSNTIVITLQYTYDLNDEHDRDSFERELKRGNEFLEYQKRIMRNGRLLSVENGYYVGNVPPYGYRRVQVKDGKKKYFTLEPDPEQAPVVKMIFELYAQGISSHQIARTLDQMGVPTQKGGRWSAESLKTLRTNVHYIGMVRWNRRKSIKFVEDGEVVSSRPLNDDYLICPGKHEAIIDRDLWDTVQELRDKIPPIKARSKCVNPLAGLIYCQCGRPMTMRTYMRNGKERSAPRLVCSNMTPCGTASCTAKEMTQEVMKILQNAIADFDLQIQNSKTDNTAIRRQTIVRLEHRLDELNKLELAQWEKYTQEAMPKHIFDALNEKVLKERADVQLALIDAKESIPEVEFYEAKRETFYAALALMQDEEAPAQRQNLLLKKCIKKIVYNRAPKKSNNRRYGESEQMELEVHLNI